MLVRSLPWAPLVVAPQTKNNEGGWLDGGRARCRSHSPGVYRGMNISCAQDHFLQCLHKGSGPTHGPSGCEWQIHEGSILQMRKQRPGAGSHRHRDSGSAGAGPGSSQVSGLKGVAGLWPPYGAPQDTQTRAPPGALPTISGSPSSPMSPSTGGGN